MSQQPDPLQKLQVVTDLFKEMYERRAFDEALELCDRIGETAYADADLEPKLQRLARFKRAEVLINLKRYDEARRAVAALIAEHASDQERRPLLVGVLLLATHLLARTDEPETAKFAKSLHTQLTGGQPIDVPALLAEVAKLLVRMEAPAQALAVALHLDDEAIDPDAALAHLAVISAELQRVNAWEEALQSIDILESLVLRMDDSMTRGRLGVFEMSRAEILRTLGEFERAEAVGEQAQLVYGDDMLVAVDLQIADAATHLEPRATLQRATSLLVKAHLLAEWDDDRLEATLELLGQVYAQAPPNVRELCAEVAARWPEYFE